MSAPRLPRTLPPPALQPQVLIPTPLATCSILRINDTRHWPLSKRYRSNFAAQCPILVESTATLSPARHLAIAQIPIAHHLG